MRYSELLEFDVKGKKASTTKYKQLYHLTDYRGFSYSVSQDKLSAFRYPYISTTYDPNMNSVGGRDHYHFKFILNGTKILSEFEANHYKSYANYTDGSGKHNYDEKEIAIDTKALSPLRDYVDGLVITIDIYSRSFIQWMFYTISERSSFMGGETQAAAPRGINSLFEFHRTWGKPLYVQSGTTIRNLNEKEKAFISFCYKLIKRKITFDKALELLTTEFPEEIKDHWGERLTVDELKSDKIFAKVMTKINNELTSKPIGKLKPERIKQVIINGFKVFGYSDDIIARFIKACEENNMFHQLVEPIFWNIIFKDIPKNKSPNAVIDNIGWVGDERVSKKLAHFGNDEWMQRSKHSRAGFN